MARRKKNPGLGTLVGVVVVAGLGYLVYKEVEEDKAKKALKKAKPRTVKVGTADAPSSVAMKVGETVRIKVPKVAPLTIEAFTEATAGDPIIVMTEKPDQPGSGAAGDYGSEVVDVKAHAPGTVLVNFLYQPAPGSPDQASSAGSVNLIIT